VKLPEEPEARPNGWVPPGEQDVRVDKIDINRDPRFARLLAPRQGLAAGHRGRRPG